MKEKINYKNVKAYIQGKFRYAIYYSRFKELLIRTHILDQIEMRIELMEADCYNQGSCIKCGCVTTALQMADKACNKPCYPPMMNLLEWMNFFRGKAVELEGATWKLTLNKRREIGSEGAFIEKIYYLYKNNEIVHIRNKREKWNG